MVAYNFQPRFAPLVASGVKRQTIRATRKRHALAGEFLQLYAGQRTKKCQKIVTPDPVCKSVEFIYIVDLATNLKIVLSGKELTKEEKHQLAIADGFENVEDMFEFFANTHGLPFTGVLIKW